MITPPLTQKRPPFRDGPSSAPPYYLFWFASNAIPLFTINEAATIARRAATVSGSASPTDISTQATFAVEISATAATTSTSVDRGLIKCASSFTDNEKGPGPVSLGLISVLLCCRLLRQLPSRVQSNLLLTRHSERPPYASGPPQQGKLGNSVSRQPGDPRHLPTPAAAVLHSRENTLLTEKKAPFSGRPGDSATQRLRDLATP